MNGSGGYLVFAELRVVSAHKGCTEVTVSALWQYSPLLHPSLLHPSLLHPSLLHPSLRSRPASSLRVWAGWVCWRQQHRSFRGREVLLLEVLLLRRAYIRSNRNTRRVGPAAASAKTRPWRTVAIVNLCLLP